VNANVITYLPLVLIGIIFIIARLIPAYIGVVFIINLWALSYPHNVATFFLEYFDDRRTKLKATALMLCFLALNIFIVLKFGLIIFFNIYFYLRIVHYTRQNFGVIKINSPYWTKFDSYLFHGNLFLALLSMWGSGVDSFLGYKIYTIDLPSSFKYSIFIGLNITIVREIFLYKKGLIREYKNHVLHYALLIPFTQLREHTVEIWIYLNLLHNIQYLSICFDTFKIQRKEQRFIKYILPILIFVAVLYGTIMGIGRFVNTFLPVSVMIVIAVNFTHYYYDTFLWKKIYRTI
jgi:hypothetical protein